MIAMAHGSVYFVFLWLGGVFLLYYIPSREVDLYNTVCREFLRCLKRFISCVVFRGQIFHVAFFRES